MKESEQYSIWSLMRLATPLLVTVCLFIITGMNTKIDSIDEKLFRHLTNDDMHTPKSIVVTKAEFNIYQGFRDKQMCDLRDAQMEIRDTLKQIMRGLKQ